MALRHFANDLGYSVRQTEMNCDGGYDHCQHCYPYAHHAVVTVIAIGVSLTNVRPALWHAAAAMVFRLASGLSASVGNEAAAMGTVKSCDKGCIRVQPQPPPSGV